MNREILQALRTWRDEQARIEGVANYRVLPNATLDALVGRMPKTTAELCEVKGIKEAKCQKYGKAILSILGQFERSGDEAAPLEESVPVSHEPLSISQFLDGINIELSGLAARVRGEISSVNVTPRVVYFTLKDATDGSVLNCLIFQYQYAVSGIKLAEGDEIIVEGFPEIYKPSGKFSLKVGIIEYAGEGALKKAYDLLYQKMEKEGLFAPEKKRPLPKFPERIALITSRDGAAIDDFRMNLGLQGIKIDFYPTSVEGKRAVFEILEAIQFFNRTPERYDLLVIVRGGGSLESLQAFNNETLVREVAQSKIPTLLGVGHERDVTLSALAADLMVSTPTATAKTIALPREEARQLVTHFERTFPLLLQDRLFVISRTLSESTNRLVDEARQVRTIFSEYEHQLKERSTVYLQFVRQKKNELDTLPERFLEGFRFIFQRMEKELMLAETELERHDPKRALRLGYSLIRQEGSIVKDVSEIQIDDILDIQLDRGSLEAAVKKINRP